MASAFDLTGSASLQAADIPEKTLTAFIDRWIYVFMATLFIVVVLVGFIPDSITKVGMVDAGKRPPFPLVLHMHAVAMGCWLLLLLAQTLLMATGRSAGHRQLGMAGMVLAPVVVVIGLVLSPTMYHQLWNGLHAAPGGLNEAAQMALMVQARITLLQMQIGVLFPLVVALALYARKRDFATHKRLMILVPAAPLIAAIDRMRWLPNNFPMSPIGSEAYVLLLIAPIFLWDLYRLGRVRRAYLVWFGLFATTSIAVNLLWNSVWWQGFVPKLMAVA